jgi:hypothetical protein
VALSGDRNWRKGNPNWKKGRGGNPAGPPKGTFRAPNASAFRVLMRKHRNPVEELIKLADFALSKGDYLTAIDLWTRLHEETTKHSSEIEAAGRKADLTADLVKALEGGEVRVNASAVPPSAPQPIPNVTNSGTEIPSNKSSVANGLAALSPEADTAGNLRLLDELQGTDLRGQLQSAAWKDDDHGGDSHRDGAEDAE